jgi:amidase
MQFINFILQPENAALISNFARYANGITGSEPLHGRGHAATRPEIVVPEILSARRARSRGRFSITCPREPRSTTSTPRSGPNCCSSNPAGWNNVYGMRPSWGRVPDDPGGETYLHPLGTDGPMARSPRDLAALLEAMAGPEPRVPFCLPKQGFLEGIDSPVAGRRIAWLGDWGGVYPFEPGILELCASALAGFGDLGVTVEALEPPFAATDLWQSWMDLRAFRNASNLGPLYDDPRHRPQLKATLLWEIEQGRALTLEAVERASLIRSRWYARAAELFESFDAVALPTAQVWPFPIDREYPTEIAGRAMDTYHRWMEAMIPASLIGLPAISVPAGFGENGLPMGLQLIGRHGADAELLQLAHAWHQATDWPNRRPPPGV